MYYFVYGIFYLLSLLPFFVLYLISDFFYFITYYIIGYRRQVVMDNLLMAFPEKTTEERKKISKKFYHNLVDTFIESIKFISISKKTVEKRSTADLQIVHQLIDKGYNVHLVAGHQFNWEFGNALFAMQLSVPFVAVYMPIENEPLNKLFYQFRKRFGTILISVADFKLKMHRIFSKQYILGLVADQNLGVPAAAYWINFFGRPVPFAKGPAKGATRKNTAFVMVTFHKIKRGHYHFNCRLLAENASLHTPQQLTVMFKNELEKAIRENPSNYLWSHRRWKREWKPEYGNIIEG